MEAKETHLLSLKVGSWSSTTKRPSCVISAHASSFSSSPVVTSKHFGSCTRPPRSSKGISWYSRHKLLCLSRFTPRKSCCPWMRQCVSNNLLLFCTILFYFLKSTVFCLCLLRILAAMTTCLYMCTDKVMRLTKPTMVCFAFYTSTIALSRTISSQPFSVILNSLSGVLASPPLCWY